MKFNIKRLVALLLVICSFALVLTACGEGSSSGGASSKKLTEETIKSELADSEGELDGTLTIEDGSPENVKAFVESVVPTYHPAGEHGTTEKPKAYEEQLKVMASASK